MSGCLECCEGTVGAVEPAVGAGEVEVVVADAGGEPTAGEFQASGGGDGLGVFSGGAPSCPPPGSAHRSLSTLWISRISPLSLRIALTGENPL